MGPSRRLSFVVATRNKLPFLQEAMRRLLPQVGSEDELVVVDGASNDGSQQYLEGLHAEGRIQTLLRGGDINESHAWNKGMLAARGELIKLVSDDDAFCYSCIAACRDVMLANAQVDVLSGTVADISLVGQGTAVPRTTSERDLRRWREDGTPFWFNGLPLMLRRQALPLSGLFNTAIECPDTEFSLRITTTPGLLLAWCHSTVCVRIDNPRSKWRQRETRVQEDSERVLRFYRPQAPPGLRTRVLAWARRLLQPAVQPKGPGAPSFDGLSEESIAAAFVRSDAEFRRDHQAGETRITIGRRAAS